jgi:putative SOS response-associated peptidase YedK
MGPDGSELDSCCVITTQPNQLLKSLHDRMPVVIPDGLEGVWLEAGDHNHRKALEPMLTPWDGTNWKRDGERQLPLF